MTASHTKKIQGQRAYHSGQAAEASVASYYERRGYALTDQRWRSSVGEIDLVFLKDLTVIFVEVKKSRTAASAAAHLSAAQQRRLGLSAEEYLGRLPDGLLTPARFDVALVSQDGTVDVIENVVFGH